MSDSLLLSCICLLLIGALACGSSALQKHGQHYQLYADYHSLEKVVEGIEIGADTAFVRSILGEPINMGFDYRYLVDSSGPTGCVMGAVFHIDEDGKIDDKWIDEVCE